MSSYTEAYLKFIFIFYSDFFIQSINLLFRKFCFLIQIIQN